MGALVWGKTIRMASANKLFAAKDLTNQTKAAKVYEDMAVDEPNSPYVLHNLGLSQYVQGKFDQAASSLQKALKALEGVKLSPKLAKTLFFPFQYHSGNSMFKLAAKSQSSQSGQSNQAGQSIQSGQAGQGQPQQPVNLYQAALESYQKAIEANPDDLDAKYNYELTKLRIKQEKNQQNQNQQSQDQQNQQGQPNQNQNNQQQSGNQKNQQGQQNQSQKQQGNQSKPGEMSKEEAEALLKMAEKGEQYQGQLIFGAESPTTKDW